MTPLTVVGMRLLSNALHDAHFTRAHSTSGTWCVGHDQPIGGPPHFPVGPASHARGPGRVPWVRDRARASAVVVRRGRRGQDQSTSPDVESGWRRRCRIDQTSPPQMVPSEMIIMISVEALML